MKLQPALLISFLAAIAMLHSAPVKTFSLFLEDQPEGKNEKVYTISNIAGDDPVSFPILFRDKICVFSLNVYIAEKTKLKTVSYSIQDPSYILPGGGTNSGSAQYIFAGTFPYATGRMPIIISDVLKLSVKFSDNGE